ncbi:MAG: TolC family protein [Calditrichaeota bacterium]|nr:TolC family protein [Calditrichota bacterium]
MKYVLLSFILFILLIFPGNSSGQKRLANQPEAPPLLKTTLQDAKVKNKSLQLPSGSVTLIDALTAALRNNPMLAVYSFEIRAREAQTLQASFRPNPEVGIELENFAGSAPLRGFGESELTLSVGQLIELGGKRSKRTEVAALNSDLAAWDYEIARLLVFSEVVKSFNAVLVAQKKVELQSEIIVIAEQFLQRIEYRVKAGNLSPAETARARVELSSNQILLQTAQRELNSTRHRLAAAWGSEQPSFDKVSGDLHAIVSIPPFKSIIKLISQNPQVARRAVEIQMREKELQLAKANRLPDPTIAGGYRRLNDAGAGAFVMSLSIPLQIFNRNQGNIESAKVKSRQAAYQKQVVELELKVRLAKSYNRLVSVHQEIQILKTNILVQAEKAYQTINQGYNMGKFSFLDLLDAQRTLFDVRSRYLDALREYHFQRAEIEQLVGQDLSSIQKNN